MKRKSPDPGSSVSVRELAGILECPFEGDGSIIITGAAGLKHAGEGDLIFLGDPKKRDSLLSTLGSAAILPLDFEFDRLPVIRSSKPHRTFIQALEILYRFDIPDPGIHPQALVAASAELAEDVRIGPYAIIGENVRIGKGTLIFPFVMISPDVVIGRDTIIHSHSAIRENSRIGDRVIIHNGVVIGADGFGYFPNEDGTHLKIPQVGSVIIEDDVEIGALSAIDRAALDTTVIRKGTKIDNLVQIAHSVIVGENSILASQTGIAGSSTIGKNVIMAGQVGIADHVTVGDKAIIAAKTGVPKDVPEGAVVAGIPHRDIREWRKASIALGQLYDLLREVKKLKKRIETLESKK